MLQFASGKAGSLVRDPVPMPVEEAIDEAIARLAESGLVDDAAFAQYWVENREEFRPRAGRALRFELRRKGLADSDINAAIGAVDENESAYRAGLEQEVRDAGFVSVTEKSK